jgi:hypothetical protein
MEAFVEKVTYDRRCYVLEKQMLILPQYAPVFMRNSRLTSTILSHPSKFKGFEQDRIALEN